MKNASAADAAHNRPQVILGVTGSIAAYKGAELLRLMIKASWNVNVIMTEAAGKFVTPLTFQTLSRNKVVTDIFAPIDTWKPEHIALAELAEFMIIAPCTANVIAKIAHGLADDSLTATALAFRGGVAIAPAMNDAMYENRATRDNLALIASRGVQIIEPNPGELACGSSGRGRMAEPIEIFEAIRERIRA